MVGVATATVIVHIGDSSTAVLSVAYDNDRSDTNVGLPGSSFSRDKDNCLERIGTAEDIMCKIICFRRYLMIFISK